MYIYEQRYFGKVMYFAGFYFILKVLNITRYIRKHKNSITIKLLLSLFIKYHTTEY